MKDEKKKIRKIPIKRAQELSERYSYPKVIILAMDEEREIAAGASYGKTKELCKEAGRLLDAIFAEQGFGRDDAEAR